MLKRLLMEASFNVHIKKDYHKEQRQMHTDLLNAAMDEIKLRRSKCQTKDARVGAGQ